MTRGRIGLSQSLTHIYPFPHSQPSFFIFLSPIQQPKKKKITYVERSARDIWHPASSPNYAYVCTCYIIWAQKK